MGAGCRFLVAAATLAMFLDNAFVMVEIQPALPSWLARRDEGAYCPGCASHFDDL
jgi:hypothetical protein